MDNIKKDIPIDEFLVLKTIETLYKNNVISEALFKTILNDYSTKVDTSQFSCYN